MKKVFFIVSIVVIRLAANYIHPIQTLAQTDADPIPYYLSPAYIEEKSKKPVFYIKHGKHPNWLAFKGSVYNFYDKRIFFDRDSAKKPIYKKISEHAADNPNFGNVLLVIYHHKKKHSKQFVILGTYSNPVARKKFLRKMKTLFGYACARATWCPEQKAFILSKIDIVNDGWGHNIDIAFDPKIGQKFDQWIISQKFLTIPT